LVDNLSSEINNPWRNFGSTLFQNPFFLFSIFAIILISSLMYIRTKYFANEEKEVIESSSEKPKNSYYPENLSAKEQRKIGQCDKPKKDYVVVFIRSLSLP